MTKDIFTTRSASPILIKAELDAPFNSPDYLYELKFDGIRCLLYVDQEYKLSDLQNKRKKILNVTYPELNDVYSQVRRRCILDGELVAMTNGKPDFIALERRAVMTNKFRIGLAAKRNPVQFVAYDILYLDEKPIIDRQLLERKRLLDEVVKENEQISVSRYLPEKGIEFFNLVAARELEGIVAKKLGSVYFMGRESNRDWIKIKVLHDQYFLICGYIPNDAGGVKSILLGAYHDGKLIYQGSVGNGIPPDVSSLILQKAAVDSCPSPFDARKIDAVWFMPDLVCTIKFMRRTGTELTQQARFKGLVFDKTPEECVL